MIASQDYRGGLGAEELVRTLQSLLAAERAAIRLVCRYLADLADCLEDGRDRALGNVDDGPGGALGGHDALFAYADIYHAAECLFGLGAHSTRERIRVGRALRSLPRIEGALLSGELSYSRAREVTRVATPADESPWLERALTLPMRTLERRVVEATGKEPPARHTSEPPARTSEPARLRFETPETVEVTLRLPAEAWALLQRAMEGARRASEASLSDAEALAAVARDAFERQNEGADPADPRRTVVLYECQSCSRAEVDTGAGPLEIGAGAAAALGCGARVRDLRSEGRVVSRGGPLPRAMERAVRLRDRDTCRVPGCRRRRYVDVHHIALRSEGGEHSRSNCVCLCTTHHGLLHDGRLHIEGDAEGELRFLDEAGAPLGRVPRWDRRSGCRVPRWDCRSTCRVPRWDCREGGAGEEAARLLALMGRNGRWSVDALVEASGFRVGSVQTALLCLEIDGRVASDGLGTYGARAPVGLRTH